jgi:CheY-like chemotaxis protein
MEKILIVDDVAHLRLLVRKYLERAGFSVMEAVNGEEAMQAVGRYAEIKLIFLDMMMPVMNGLEFLKWAGPVKKDFGISICALTAKYSLPEIKECLRQGADDYLVKPVDEMMLVNKANILLAKKDLQHFNMSKVSMEGWLETSAGKIPVEIHRVSESSVVFTSEVQLPLGARVFVNSEDMQEVLGIVSPFLLRIYQVERQAEQYLNVGTFIGLKDSDYKSIRSVTTRRSVHV